jgi:prepilin-type N-terminal cleavage/methylation domain-containing protein
MMKKITKAIQKGFTLIELVIVVLVLGVLISVVAAQFNGGITDSARAMALYDASSKLSTNWQILNQNCGTPTNSTSNPIFANGASALDILVVGPGTTGSGAYIASQYQACYNTAGIRPLSDVIQGSKGGPYTVQNTYAVTMTGGGGIGSPLVVQFDNVSSEAVAALVTKYGTPSDLNSQGGLDPTKADTTGTTIQFTAEDSTTHLRTLKIIRPI